MPEHLDAKALSIQEYGKQHFLRPHQRDELERSIAHIDERLANPVILELTGGNREALLKQRTNEAAMLHRGTPPRLSAPDLKKVYTRLKKCEELITNGQPSWTQMERARPSDIDNFIAHENTRHADRDDGTYTTKRAVLARKNYLMTLDWNLPQERRGLAPHEMSQAVLRSDTVRGDSPAYRRNYDFIQWEDATEASLSAEIDDDTYAFFVGLKTLGWADSSIQKKLDWTQPMYAAAMARWRGEAQGQHASTAQNGAQVTAATTPPTRLEHAHRQFTAELHALGLSVKDACVAVHISPVTFKSYERRGWSLVKHKELTQWIAKKTRAVQRSAEPADDKGERAETPEAEPASLSTEILRAFGTKIEGKPV